MKQPNINIFGKAHKVVQIEFNAEGFVEKVVYEVAENMTKTVFKGDKVMNSSLTRERIIQMPTQHPYHNYAYAPNLEALLVSQ